MQGRQFFNDSFTVEESGFSCRSNYTATKRHEFYFLKKQTDAKPINCDKAR